MDPIAFEVFGLAIRWYGILMATAIFVGIVLASKEAKKLGLPDDLVTDIVLYTVPAGIIGARAYYVIFSWDYYQGDIMRMLNIRGGGLAIHGAIIGAMLAGYVYAKVKKLDFWQLTDMVAPSLIIGQAIGRWGNFANQEAHGGPTDLPWGIMVEGVKVHPTFLYESIWNLLVFTFLVKYRKNKKFEGELIAIYFVLYSIGRFMIEGLRTDSLMIGPLRMAQVISLGFIAVFGAWILYKRKNLKSS